MHSLIAGTIVSVLVATAALAAADDAAHAVSAPTVKTTTTRQGHDIAPLPGGKVAPISQSDKDNVNNAVDYFEKKLKPSRRKKAAKTAEFPAAASAPTSK